MPMTPHTVPLDLVVDLMRDLSRLTDPQEAAALYGAGLRQLNLVPNDRYLSLSRRDLPRPQYRITRNSSWQEHPNPWTQKHKLPLFSGGLLAEILYSNRPAIITDLPGRLSADDPAFDLLKDMELLVSLPHFDQGESINAGVLLNRTAEGFPFQDVPMMIWQANLWGRATLNLVNRQKLQQANDAMDRELRVVADIQRSLLPRELPAMDGARVAAHYQTSQRAGGDYYDFFPLPGGQWGLLLADVSGHGTPAAVLMAITHAIAHTHPGDPMPPSQLLGFVNAHLATHYTQDNGSFVTAVYAVWDPRERTLTYASAGHPSPRVRRGGEILCADGESSLPLGVARDEGFINHVMHLLPGDKLVFYTDGITEAFDSQGEAFGTRRLDAAICDSPDGQPQAVVDAVLRHLCVFAGRVAASDDRTLVVMTVL